MSVRSSFCILTEVGDLLDGGELHFEEAVPTLEIAKQRIISLAKSRPALYVTYDGDTGERIIIPVE
jgi:hypothetical protein